MERREAWDWGRRMWTWVKEGWIRSMRSLVSSCAGGAGVELSFSGREVPWEVWHERTW